MCDNEKIPKNPRIFSCENCNYNTNNSKDFKKHILTRKHQKTIVSIQEIPENPKIQFQCVCGKVYKERTGMWRHKQTCSLLNKHTEEPLTTASPNDDKIIALTNMNEILTNTVMELVKENRDFKQLLIDQNKQMMELSQNAGNNNNINCNNNSNNKFNLNVFLNEKCKDAISLKDFVDSMNITLEEYIHTGEMGYIEGISRNIVKRINDMGVYDRPIHCTDLKRETIYIKDGEKWEKDEDKSELRKAVKRVAHKNHKMTTVWMENTPDVNTIGTENYEKFFKYMQSTLGGCGEKETKSFEDKIMRNIMKEVTIDKHAEERS
jgi:hypothetical protein